MASSPAAPAPPMLAPDVAEIAADAELPSSDEDAAEIEATVETVKEPQSDQEIIREMQQRMTTMEYDRKALQNKLNARDAFIVNLQKKVDSLEALKTDGDAKPAEIIPPPGVTEHLIGTPDIKEPAELHAPPGDPWEKAAASLPATKAPPPAAEPPTTLIEQKFLKLLEVV